MERRKLILACALVVLVSVTLIQVLLIYKANDRHFVYPLDDTYIHLSIARNIADNGTWGINKYEFESASSSLLYPILLALYYKYISPTDLSPLAINIVFAIVILGLMYGIVLRYNLSMTYSIALYACVIFLTPLPVMIIIGMEHTLQIAIDLAYIIISFYILSRNGKHNIVELLIFAILSIMVSAIRYEGIFLIFLIAICFIMRRQYGNAFVGLVLGLLPVIIFGFYSLCHDGYFLPNSLLLKGNSPKLSFYGNFMFIHNWWRKLYISPHLLSIIVVLAFSLFMRNDRRVLDDVFSSIIILLIGLILIHTMLAGVGWFFRYDAYLVALGVLTGLVAISDIRPDLTKIKKMGLVIILLAIALPLVYRSVDSFFRLAQASRNIYDQQFKMAEFINKYYSTEAVAINDIGAVSYFVNGNILDMYGLASKEVVGLKIHRKYTKYDIFRMIQSRNINIAIIYDRWFIGLIPDEWIKIGEWTLKDNVVCADPTVSLYACNRAEARKLGDYLVEFNKLVPASSVEARMYLNANHDDGH